MSGTQKITEYKFTLMAQKWNDRQMFEKDTQPYFLFIYQLVTITQLMKEKKINPLKKQNCCNTADPRKLSNLREQADILDKRSQVLLTVSYHSLKQVITFIQPKIHPRNRSYNISKSLCQAKKIRNYNLCLSSGHDILIQNLNRFGVMHPETCMLCNGNKHIGWKHLKKCLNPDCFPDWYWEARMEITLYFTYYVLTNRQPKLNIYISCMFLLLLSH